MKKGLAHSIHYLKRRAQVYRIIEGVLLGILLMSLCGWLWYWKAWPYRELAPALAFVLGNILYIAYRPWWGIEVQHIAFDLNLRYPSLSFSTELLLKEPSHWLEAQQRQEIVQQLEALKPSIPIPWWRWFSILAVSGFCIGASYSLPKAKEQSKDPVPEAVVLMNTSDAKDSINLTQAEVRVTAPAYMGLGLKTHSLGNFEAYEGSAAIWYLEANQDIERAYLVRAFSDTVYMKKKNKGWTLTLPLTQASVYQIALEEGDSHWRSDLFAWQILTDQVPRVQLTDKNTAQEFLPEELPSTVSIAYKASDDFALSQVAIVATISRGEGEGVKFREMQIPIADFGKGIKSVAREFLWDIKSLGLQAGDEVYYYLRATDNKRPNPQQGRSDMHFLKVKDPNKVISSDLGGLAVDIMPEYFRSQRQIIIDTEALLKDKKKYTASDFMKASNTIAADQKILRLRYGQFIGEEAESGIGVGAELALKEYFLEKMNGEKAPHESEKELNEKVAEAFGLKLEEGHFMGDGHNHESEWNAAFESDIRAENPEMAGQSQARELLTPYVHAHNEMEEATFLDEAIKTQLKAALADMWYAELYLRLANPNEALPYEYKALEKIKSIQQQSRIYVERVGFEAPPLKEEKRLSGEQKEISPDRIRLSEIEEDTRVYTELFVWLASHPSATEVPPIALVQEVVDQALAQRMRQELTLSLATLQALNTLSSARSEFDYSKNREVAMKGLASVLTQAYSERRSVLLSDELSIRMQLKQKMGKK
ncbi:hypothetical protein QWY31_00815 [Cytophagales bacterium LB-30]|uniref:DUF4175 domain-containing protein n=1 Tax=Shiella aurantiaca TaxID=3058365 RepID=A0ABT8F0U2_9BACT|nr:hypothetical protein [Shiella aurantiaca]MDN4164018.1 hypothetical protein [Shiella aurantiaca]